MVKSYEQKCELHTNNPHPDIIGKQKGTVTGHILLKLPFRSAGKWRSLVQLVLGVVLVSYGSYETTQSGNNCDEAREVAKQAGVDVGEMVLGYGAVLLEVTLSGSISIYFEKVLCVVCFLCMHACVRTCTCARVRACVCNLKALEIHPHPNPQPQTLRLP